MRNGVYNIITSNALHCAHEVGMGLFEIRLCINCGLGNPYTVISFFFESCLSVNRPIVHMSLLYAISRCITDERVYTMVLLCTGTVQIAAAVFYTATAGLTTEQAATEST